MKASTKKGPDRITPKHANPPKTPKTETRSSCKTEFRGPTDHHSSRVIARHLNTGRRIVRPWDHALDCLQNHAMAAGELLGVSKLIACPVANGGYIFVPQY